MPGMKTTLKCDNLFCFTKFKITDGAFQDYETGEIKGYSQKQCTKCQTVVSVYEAKPNEACRKCNTLMIDWPKEFRSYKIQGPCPKCKGTLKMSKGSRTSLMD